MVSACSWLPGAWFRAPRARVQCLEGRGGGRESVRERESEGGQKRGRERESERVREGRGASGVRGWG